MKNKDLIEQLQKFPENANVYLYSRNYWDIIRVELEEDDLDIDVLEDEGRAPLVVLTAGLQGEGGW